MSQSIKSLPADPTTLIQADAVLRAQVGVSVRVVRRNLRVVLAAATPAQVAAGRAWYRLAQAIARRLDVEFCLPIGMGACLIAAYSPRTRWSDNVVHARFMASQAALYREGSGVLHAPKGVMQANHKRAVAVVVAGVQENARGMGAWEAMVSALGSGPKVHAFAHNVHGLESHVTIDTWHLRACFSPGWKRGDDADQELAIGRKGVYSALAYVTAHEARRYGLSPAEFQAILWVSVRGEGE